MAPIPAFPSAFERSSKSLRPSPFSKSGGLFATFDDYTLLAMFLVVIFYWVLIIRHVWLWEYRTTVDAARAVTNDKTAKGCHGICPMCSSACTR